MYKSNVTLPNPSFFINTPLHYMVRIIHFIENGQIIEMKNAEGFPLAGKFGTSFFRVTPYVSRVGLNDIRQWGFKDIYYIRNLTLTEMEWVDCLTCQREQPDVLSPGLSYITDAIQAGIYHINSFPVFARTSTIVEPVRDIVGDEVSFYWKNLRIGSPFSEYCVEQIVTPQQWFSGIGDIFIK